MVEIADSNWLLSAIVQASAALVAIVAGLLVSRYVSLHAEQQAAARRVADLERRLGVARPACDDAERALRRHDVDVALNDDDVYEEIVVRNFEPSVAEVLDVLDRDGDDFDLAVMKVALDELVTEVETAWETLKGLVPKREEQPTWDEFRRRQTLSIVNRDVWEWAYDAIADRRAEEAREEAVRAAGRFGSILRAGQMPRILAAPPPVVRVDRDTRRRLLDARDEARVRVRELENEVALAKEHHQATRHPEGFRLALRVLRALSVLGIAVPVLLMTSGTYEFHPVLRGAVAAMFLCAVALLLRFLFVYADYLSDDGRNDLPRTVIGLFRRSR